MHVHIGDPSTSKGKKFNLHLSTYVHLMKQSIIFINHIYVQTDITCMY
jgi:hypothetical protein